MSETKLWRLFIALELPLALLEAIARAQDKLKRTFPPRAARWVDPYGIHLTLKFLGDVPVDQIGAIKAGMAKAAQGQRTFRLAVKGLGCFPNIRQPRVVWAGLAGDLDALAALQASIETHMAALGYPTEERGFNPHLTLARVGRNASREEIAALVEAARKTTVGTLGRWQVEGMSLMRSQLRPAGAIYTQVGEVKLEPGHE